MRTTALLLAALSLLWIAEPAAAAEAGEPHVAAAKQVAPAPQPDDQGGGGGSNWVDEWSARLPKVILALGSLALSAFVLLGFALLVVSAARRLFRPSLTIKPFADTGVEAKVGAVVAALVERKLIDLSRKGRRSGDGFQLDLVIANVELLARDENLATAVGGLADVSQLKAVVAVLALVDRLFGRRALVTEGELMPEGGQGSGLVLALYRHNELRARDAHWLPSSAPGSPWQALETVAANAAADPEPYYRLAERAASWVQFEAARSLNSHVALMTDRAESFRLLADGLALHRAGEIAPAARAYAESLAVDPGNVAALVNLALLLARYDHEYVAALVLLRYAQVVLERRYEETV
jgi:hypothetical protein